MTPSSSSTLAVSASPSADSAAVATKRKNAKNQKRKRNDEEDGLLHKRHHKPPSTDSILHHARRMMVAKKMKQATSKAEALAVLCDVRSFLLFVSLFRFISLSLCVVMLSCATPFFLQLTICAACLPFLLSPSSFDIKGNQEHLYVSATTATTTAAAAADRITATTIS